MDVLKVGVAIFVWGALVWSVLVRDALVWAAAEPAVGTLCQSVLFPARPADLDRIENPWKNLNPAEELSLEDILDLQRHNAEFILAAHLKRLSLQEGWKNEVVLYAARRGAPKLLALAVRAGAHVDAFSVQAHRLGRTALEAAIQRGNFALLELLVDKLGADVNIAKEHHLSPIERPVHIAVQKDRVDMVRFLLQKGAKSVWGRDRGGSTHYQLLIYAIHNGKRDLAQVILDEATDLTVSDLEIQVSHSPEARYSPLSLAAWYGWGSLVKDMLRRGADPNVTSYGLLPPLMAAVEARHYDFVTIQSLLRYGADPLYKATLWRPAPLRRDWRTLGLVKTSYNTRRYESRRGVSDKVGFTLSAWQELENQSQDKKNIRRMMNDGNYEQFLKTYHTVKDVVAARVDAEGEVSAE